MRDRTLKVKRCRITAAIITCARYGPVDAEVSTNLLGHHPRKKSLLDKVTHRCHFGVSRAAVHEDVWLAAMSMKITVNDNLERNVLVLKKLCFGLQSSEQGESNTWSFTTSGSSGSPKTAQKNVSFKMVLLPPAVSTNTFHSTNSFLFFFSRHFVPTNSLVRSFCIHAYTRHNP